MEPNMNIRAVDRPLVRPEDVPAIARARGEARYDGYGSCPRCTGRAC